MKTIPKASVVTNKTGYELEFSFCSLVSSADQYQNMIVSMRNAGFDDTFCEFLYVDNRAENTGDGFAGLNAALNQARGRYAILCHQDILAIDGPARLREVISQVSELDPNWAVLGNAGVGGKDRYYYLTERNTVVAGTKRNPIARVNSLDENFMVVRQNTRVAFSNDLTGFHLYGTDLVAQAEMRGYSCYVVDFRVEHLGLGKIDDAFKESCNRFEEKYARAFKPKTVTTTCATVDIGTLEGKGRKDRYLGFERGPNFVRPSKKAKKKIRSKLSGHTIEIDGMRFSYPEDIPFAAYHALYKGIYQQPERNLMQDYLPPDLPVVELGGSYGIVSGLLNRKLNEDARQVVVEANPELLDLCRENALAINPSRKLALVNCAIDYSGIDSISFTVTSGTHGSHVAENWRDNGTGGERISVQAITLTQLLQQECIEGEYSLVCDIEGAEFDLISQDAAALSNCRAMIVELHPGVFYDRGKTVQQLLEKLEAYGFEIQKSEATVVAAVRPT